MDLIDLPQVSEKRAKALKKNGIVRPLDLLNFFPRRYLDRTHIPTIGQLRGSGEEVTVVGQVKTVRQQGSGNKKRLEVFIEDDFSLLKGVFFRGISYFKKAFNEGDLVAFHGKVKRYGRYLSMAHPDIDKLDKKDSLDEITGIIPIYPGNKDFSNAYISNKLIQKWIRYTLEHEELDEFLPSEVLEEYQLMPRPKAYRKIHFPDEQSDHRQALYRFKFEELLLFQLGINKLRQQNKDRADGSILDTYQPNTGRFFNEVLPFSLTGGQRSALHDIKKDLRSGVQMNRLIQGDVGSGKTIVALGAILIALDSGYQTAFMAPTEILAEQHYRTLSDFLEPLDINIRLLVGSQNKKLRQDVLTDVEGGGADIVVGTHAVIQEQVRFHNLGLIVIDEQHRFGVRQRAELLNKGEHPHLLVMSATPIPRSLALTLYSDLDISLIKDMPAGRKPVKTAVRSPKKREEVHSFMDEELTDGGQAFVVYPLVEESESMDLQDATKGYKRLEKRFDRHAVGLLHGRMKVENKEKIMQQFIRNEIQILVTTTVIEVGVDIPNAHIMLIEHAERFGLSQLHQLRGRIGRGERTSYCILMPDGKLSDEAQFRLNTMVNSSDGFEIAEADLKLRGPGDFMGTKQSGVPEFNVADIVEDQSILRKTKKLATRILEQDPDLTSPEHQDLRKIFEPYFKEKSNFFTMA